MNENKNIHTDNKRNTIDHQQGNWYLFNIYGKKIVAWASVISGKECVFIDDVLVSKKRSFGLKSYHELDIEGNKITISFVVKNLLTGKIHCTLFENDTPKIKFESKINIFSFLLILISFILAVFLSGVLVLIFRLPTWIIILVSIICIFLLTKLFPKIIYVSEIST